MNLQVQSDAGETDFHTVNGNQFESGVINTLANSTFTVPLSSKCRQNRGCKCK
jgi:hypothetical protein